MAQSQPKETTQRKNLIEEFIALGGDPRLLEHLETHPALDTIKRLHQEELDKVQLAGLLSELNDKLNECRGLTLEINRTKSVGGKHDRWTKLLGRVLVGVISEIGFLKILPRKGVIIDIPEIYFTAACLVPYTASLGKSNKPNWKWIERWISQGAGLGTKNIKQLWDKEIIHRKVWPSRTLFYALASGAAVPLEQERGGRKAAWATAWRFIQERMPSRTEPHPVKLRRSLRSCDRTYAELAVKYVPLAKWDLGRMYPELAGYSQEATDLLRGLVDAGMAQRMAAGPARLRLRIQAIKGILVDRKAEFKKENDKIIAAYPPEYRAWLKKEMTKSLRRNLARLRKHP